MTDLSIDGQCESRMVGQSRVIHERPAPLPTSYVETEVGTGPETRPPESPVAFE